MIIIFLIYLHIQNNKKIYTISKQVEDILFQQKDLYVQKYDEGALSILESEIVKLVNRLYEQNSLLNKDKIMLKQSLEDISHQMKTPLTTLNLIHEQLKIAEGKEKRKLLREQQQLFDKIEWLVSSLLKIAQLDAGTVAFQKEEITYQELIQQLLKSFEIQIDIKNIDIQLQFDSDELISIDILWTLEALSNIIKNCIEHIDDNGTIMINIHQNPLYDEMIIQDNGEGIDSDDLPHLFERFYKGKNATSSSVGIGLALSRMIIEKQNGTITVENSHPGVKFTIHFYKEVI